MIIVYFDFVVGSIIIGCLLEDYVIISIPRLYKYESLTIQTEYYICFDTKSVMNIRKS